VSIKEPYLANQLSNLQHLIRQLGPNFPQVLSITEDDLDSWQINFDTGLSLQISWQETPARVLLYCAIGKPDESQREKIFARLLTMNLLLQGVANLKLALSSPEDDVIVIGECESTALTLEILQAEISDYLRFAAHFSELINKKDIETEQVDSLHVMNLDLLRA
jgi:hypothetical protein